MRTRIRIQPSQTRLKALDCRQGNSLVKKSSKRRAIITPYQWQLASSSSSCIMPTKSVYQNFGLNTTRSYTIVSTTTSNPPGTEKSSDKDVRSAKNEMDRLLAMASIEVSEISKLIVEGAQRNDQQRIQNESKGKGPINEMAGVKGKLYSTINPTNQNDAAENSLTTINNVQREIAAAEALLKLTSKPKFQIAFRVRQKQNYCEDENENLNIVHNFHYTFLSAVEWLCQTLIAIPCDSQSNITPDTETYTAKLSHDSNAILLLKLLMDLNERSQKLNLPLTLPLYKKLCTMIARHGIDNPTLPSLYVDIIELSTVARDCLSSPELLKKKLSYSEDQVIQASFFTDAMKELLQRNQIRDMIGVLSGMKSVHDIHSVDLHCGLELLSKLKEKVDESLRNGALIFPTDSDIDENDEPVIDSVKHSSTRQTQPFDEDDAIQLATLLHDPVMQELTMKKKELEEFEFNDAVNSLLDSAEYDNDWDDTVFDDDDDDDDDNNNSDDFESSPQLLTDESSTDYDDDFEDASSEFEEDIKKLNNLVKSMEMHKNDAGCKEAAQTAAIKLLKKIRRRRNRSVPIKEIEFEETSRRAHITEEHEYRMRDFYDILYVRDQTWDLPDLVPQLEEWNSNTNLFFSEEYENELIREISNEDYQHRIQDDDDDDDE